MLSQPSDMRFDGLRFATFQPNIVKLLAVLSKSENCPDSITWEFQCARNWITPVEVSVSIGKGVLYETLAPQVLALNKEGVSMKTIATKLGVTRETAANALRFATYGKRPASELEHAQRGGKPLPTRYKAISAEVVRLQDEVDLSFPKIGKRLGVNEGTVRRAYDFGRPDVVDRAVQGGPQIQRGKWSHLGGTAKKEIVKRLANGQSLQAIAKAMGCCPEMVTRIKNSQLGMP